jgi:hypothetical protein
MPKDLSQSLQLQPGDAARRKVTQEAANELQLVVKVASFQ